MHDFAKDIMNSSMLIELLLDGQDADIYAINKAYSYLDNIPDDKYKTVLLKVRGIKKQMSSVDELKKELDKIIKNCVPELYAQNNAKAPIKEKKAQQVNPKQQQLSDDDILGFITEPENNQQEQEKQVEEPHAKQPKEETFNEKLAKIHKAYKNVPEDLFNTIVASFGIITGATPEQLEQVRDAVNPLNEKLASIPAKPVGKSKVKEILSGLKGIENGMYNGIPLGQYVDTIIADNTPKKEAPETPEEHAAKLEQERLKAVQQAEQKAAEQAAKKQAADAEREAKKQAKQAEIEKRKQEEAEAKRKDIETTISTSNEEIANQCPEISNLYAIWVSNYQDTISEKTSVQTVQKNLGNASVTFSAINRTIKLAYEEIKTAALANSNDMPEYSEFISDIVQKVSIMATDGTLANLASVSSFKKAVNNALQEERNEIITKTAPIDPPREQPIEINEKKDNEPVEPEHDTEKSLEDQADSLEVGTDDNPFNVSTDEDTDPETIRFSPEIEQRLQRIFSAIDANTSFAEESEAAKNYVRQLLSDDKTDKSVINDILGYNDTKRDLLRKILINSKDDAKPTTPEETVDSKHASADIEHPDEATDEELDTAMYPPDSKVTEYTGMWERAIIPEFGYPFINFSSPLISDIISGNPEAKAAFKNQLRHAQLKTNRLAGRLWDYLFSTPVKLMIALAKSKYVGKKLNYIRVSSSEMFSDSELIYVDPIKINNIDTDFYDTQMVSRVFINQFYKYISVEDIKIYAKYNEMSEEQYVELLNSGARPDYYVMVPQHRASFRISETTTASGFGGTLLSLLSFRDKSVLVRAKINGKEGGFVMPKKVTDNLFAKYV